MSVKAILVFCASAVFFQSAFSYCIPGGHYNAGLVGCGLGAPALAAPGLAGNGLACGAGYGYGAGLGCGGLVIEAIPTTGGGLPVTSTSAIAPTGLSVSSENVYEGALSVAGELPFLSVVALEGVLPSAGAGAVSYSCGNGITAIESIAPGAVVVPAAEAYGPGVAAYGPGLAEISSAAASLAPGLGFGSHIGHGCGCGLY